MINVPLVSIIIPTYSRPINLRRAIDSVLNQSYSNIEIIVVDDNGRNTDFQKQTEAALKKYFSLPNFQYIVHQENKNGSAARNTGIRCSKGEYIGFLDDDDEFVQDKIEKQVVAMESLSSDWGGCYCNTLNIGRYKRRFIHNVQSGNLKEDLLLLKITLNSSTLLLRKEVCELLRGFDESFQRHQDWEFLVRFFRKYKLALVEPERYLIVKYMSISTSNIPLGERAYRLRSYYLDIYKEDILQSDHCNTIMKKQWLDFTYSSIALGDKFSLVRQGLEKASSYKRIAISEYLKIVFCFFKRTINSFT